MLEFDVRRTADDELVLYHDEAIGDRPLASLTYAAALRAVSARRHPIPRLVELLDAAHGRVMLDIEIKEAGYEARLLSLVFDRGFQRGRFRRDVVRGGRNRAGQAREA